MKHLYLLRYILPTVLHHNLRLLSYGAPRRQDDRKVKELEAEIERLKLREESNDGLIRYLRGRAQIDPKSE